MTRLFSTATARFYNDDEEGTRRTVDIAQEMLYNISWACGMLFLFCFFINVLTTCFFRYNERLTCFQQPPPVLMTMTRKEQEGQWILPKKCYTTSLGHVVCYLSVHPVLLHIESE